MEQGKSREALFQERKEKEKQEKARREKKLKEESTFKVFENQYQIQKIGVLQIFRHLVQIAVLLLVHGKIFGLKSTGIVVPFLHASQSPWSTVMGTYESLEFSISRGVIPIALLGVICLTGITVGRLFCGWACPFGLFQDLLSYLPFKKTRGQLSTQSSYYDIKTFVLATSILLVILSGFRRIRAATSDGTETDVASLLESPFAILSPAGTLFAYLPWIGYEKSDVLFEGGFLAWGKLAVFVIIVAASFYTPRFFCRYVCPMGAALQPMSKFKFLRIKKSAKLPRDQV